MKEFLEFIYPIAQFGYYIRGIAGCFAIYGFIRFIKDYCMFKTVNLSIGSFVIQRKYYDYQNMTNIVSTHFYNGGRIDDDVRREILEKINHRVFFLKKAQDKTNIEDYE